MTIVVPFDKTPHSAAAVARASAYSAPNEVVRAVSVIPRNNRGYARDRSWIGENEPFDLETVVSRLEASVGSIDSDVVADHILVGRYAPSGTIAREIRTYAKKHDTRLVAIGSDNAGSIVSNVSSVGSGVASDSAYDVLIVRQIQ